MTVRELMAQAGLTAAVLADGDREVTGGYVGDLLSWVMGRVRAGDAWVTIMSNRNIVAVAALADPSCVILAENVSPDEGVAALAEEKGINLLLSPDNAFTLAARIGSLL